MCVRKPLKSPSWRLRSRVAAIKHRQEFKSVCFFFVLASAFIVAARVPGNVCDPWVRWQRSGWDLIVRLAATLAAIHPW